MRIIKTLKPCQDRTKSLLARYGPSLLCLRYRSDEVTRQRLKAVELVVQRGSRQTESLHSAARRVSLRVDGWETDVRRRVKAAGGWWGPPKVSELVRLSVVLASLQRALITEVGLVHLYRPCSLRLAP